MDSINQELLKKENKQIEVSRKIHKPVEQMGSVMKERNADEQDMLIEEQDEERLLLDDKIQEVRKEDGVATLKGEQPAGPKYIGFDKKFTRIEEIDSERMVAVKAALSLYLADQNRETVTRLIEACDAYCKGRFAFFKAFRRAGVRLAEVKALRAEALHLQEAYTNAKFADNLIYDEEDEDYSSVKTTSKKDKLKSKTYQEEEKQIKFDAMRTDANGFDNESDGYFDEEDEYDSYYLLSE